MDTPTGPVRNLTLLLGRSEARVDQRAEQQLPQVFAARISRQIGDVLEMMRSSGRKSGPEVDSLLTTFYEATTYVAHPPTEHFLLFVQYQHDMNGKTWPRAWALVTYLKLVSWYYRRKSRRSRWLEGSLGQPQHDYDENGHVIR